MQLAILLGNDHTDRSKILPSVRFAMNTSITQSTGETPAYLTFAREVRSPDDVSRDLTTIISTEDLTSELKTYLLRHGSTLRETRDLTEREAKRRTTQANLKRRDVEGYAPDDRVWVATHARSDAAASSTSKFVPRRDGPYQVLKKTSESSYEVADPRNPTVPLGK